MQLIATALVNFTLGGVLSIFVFLAQLPSIIWSYQTSLFSGLAFALVAVVACCSVISGFLVLLYGAGAGAIYGVASVMGPPRLGAPRQRYQRMGYYAPRGYQRPHYA